MRVFHDALGSGLIGASRLAVLRAISPWRMCLMLWVVWGLCCVSTTASPGAAAVAQASTLPSALPDQPWEDESWYVVRMDDQRAGWFRTGRSSQGDRITTHNHMTMAIRRGGMTIHVEFISHFTETTDGQPVQAVTVQKLAQMAMTTTMRFEGDSVILITEQGSQKQQQRLPASTQAWLTPLAMERHVKRELAAGSQEIVAWSLSPGQGVEPFKTTLKVVGREPVEVIGKVVPAVVMDSEVSTMPGVVSRVYADEAGRPVRVGMAMAGIRLDLVLAEREVALSPLEPPQLLAMMLIRPTKRVSSPRTLRQGVYELKIAPVAEGASQPALPESFLPRGAHQRVVWADDATARVVVDLDSPVEPGRDLPIEADRQPSPMIDSQDPRVVALAGQAVASLPADAGLTDKAEAMRRFVYGYIHRKDLSVGFASASEVARTAQGDCTEHAVLLAAMLRSQGIAARTVSGLVYVDAFEGQDHVFGYHMWTRVWLADAPGGGRWVDLDPSLSDEHPFDATHIALSVSAMDAASQSNDLMSLAPVMGRISVTPVE